MEFKLITFVLVFSSGTLCSAEESIYQKLVDRGFEVAPGETVKLPPAILYDQMDGSAQRRAIDTILAGRYDWDTFTRKSIVSPFMLKITGGEQPSTQIGRRVDLYFVAYGSLEKLTNADYLQDEISIAASNKESTNTHAKVLSREEVRQRGLAADQDQDDTRWVAVNATFLDKVGISITTRNVKSRMPSSLLLISVVDQRFNDDAEYPNVWRPVMTDNAGRKNLGPSRTYVGLASYAKASKLADPPGALFIEYHVVFAEPPDWFHGANLIRSKLPLVAQDMVRKFRRSIERP